jgi:hypothetical protein
MKIKVARLISLNEFQLYLYDKAKKSFVYLKSDKIQNLAKDHCSIVILGASLIMWDRRPKERDVRVGKEVFYFNEISLQNTNSIYWSFPVEPYPGTILQGWVDKAIIDEIYLLSGLNNIDFYLEPICLRPGSNKHWKSGEAVLHLFNEDVILEVEYLEKSTLSKTLDGFQFMKVGRLSVNSTAKNKKNTTFLQFSASVILTFLLLFVAWSFSVGDYYRYWTKERINNDTVKNMLSSLEVIQGNLDQFEVKDIFVLRNGSALKIEIFPNSPLEDGLAEALTEKLQGLNINVAVEDGVINLTRK